MASKGKYEKGIKFVRKFFVGGNWKCNGDSTFSTDFPKNVLNSLKHNKDQVEVIVAPTNLHLTTVKGILNDKVSVGT